MQPQEFNVLLDYLKKLDEKFEKLDLQRKEVPYQSTNTKELFTALAKAQGEFPASIEQTATNPHFKSGYAKLDDIVRKIRPILAKNGLSITFSERIAHNGQTVLHTRLHFEDQWIENRIPIRPEKDNIQSYGSALTYNKRYSFMSLLCITTSNDPEDDDGESNMKYSRLKDDIEENKKITADKSVFSSNRVSQAQVSIIEEKLHDRPDIEKRLKEAYEVKEIQHLPQSEFYSICKKIEDIIKNNPYPR